MKTTLFAGAFNGDIQIWKWNWIRKLWRLEGELLGHNKAITSLDIFQGNYKNNLISGSNWGHIRIWDFEKQVQTHFIKCESEIFEC